MRGQTSIMEYILMTFFLLVVILSMILFMGWWNVTQIKIEQNKLMSNNAFLLLKDLSNSEYLTLESSVLDDSKLTAIKMMESQGFDFCEEFESVFGNSWYFEVKVLDGKPERECSFTRYPDCNSWTFCKMDLSGSRTVYNIPVNIFRKVSGKNDIALLYAGVYG